MRRILSSPWGPEGREKTRAPVAACLSAGRFLRRVGRYSATGILKGDKEGENVNLKPVGGAGGGTILYLFRLFLFKKKKKKKSYTFDEKL